MLNSEAWAQNVTGHINSITEYTYKFISIDKEHGQDLSEVIYLKIDGLQKMFDSIPPQVSIFSKAFRDYDRNRHPNLLRRLINASVALATYGQSGPNESTHSDFDHSETWKSLELDEQFDEIIKILEKILEECDDCLSKTAGDELERILNGLKKADRSNPIVMSAWIEITSRFTLTILGSMLDTPYLPLLTDVYKHSLAFRKKIFTFAKQVELSLSNTYTLKGTAISLGNDDMIDEELIIKQIEAKSSNIEIPSNSQ